jgi:hypothetical protein
VEGRIVKREKKETERIVRIKIKEIQKTGVEGRIVKREKKETEE